MRKVPKNWPVISCVKLTPEYSAQPRMPGPYAVCESVAMEMAAVAKIVKKLKGSVRLTTARRAFSDTVMGLTSGPVVKRAYQLIIFMWLAQTSVPTASSPAEEDAAWRPETARARTAPVLTTVAAVF